jgi:pimeloyl-ACP methyl ester carboxylesterase
MPHPAVMHQHLKTNPRQQLRSWYAGFFQMPWLPEQLLRAFNYKLLARSMRATARPGTFTDEEIARYKTAWGQPGALTAMLNWYRAYKYTPFEANNPVVVPTLLIWGKKDTFLGAELAQPSVEQCLNGRLEFIADATHWLHHEQPEHVNKIMKDFISLSGNRVNFK